MASTTDDKYPVYERLLVSDIDEEYPHPLRIGKEYGKAGINLWPNAEVFYKFDSSISYSMRQSINRAIEDFSAKTPVLWTPHTNQRYYVKFVETAFESNSDVGCMYLKCNQEEQKIRIRKEAPYGTVIHEMCHALGMEHEHSRADRDDYVKCFQIVHKNGDTLQPISFPEDVNFKRAQTPPLGMYDFESAMHYPLTAPNDTTEGIKLQLKDPSHQHACTVGQRKNFSTKDLEKIDILYGSEVCTFDRFGEHFSMCYMLGRGFKLWMLPLLCI